MALTRRALLRCGLLGALSLLPGCAVAPTPNEDSQRGGSSSEGGVGPDDTSAQEGDMEKFELRVGDASFAGVLASSKAGKDMASRLPMKIHMRELNGNEKYCYTGRSFPGAARTPERTSAGELWAFSGDCLVLFYEDHRNDGYEYVYVGRLDDPTGLADALGAGDVEVELL